MVSPIWFNLKILQAYKNQNKKNTWSFWHATLVCYYYSRVGRFASSLSVPFTLSVRPGQSVLLPPPTRLVLREFVPLFTLFSWERKLARVSQPRPAHAKVSQICWFFCPTYSWSRLLFYWGGGFGVGWSKSRPTKLSSYILQGFEGNRRVVFSFFRLPSVCPYRDSCSLEALFLLVLWSWMNLSVWRSRL